ncbi:MAG: RsmE family RNA methyltransferase, partial [Bacillota bacterium]
MYFFVPPAQIKEQKVIVTGPDAVHLTRVLRLGPGDGFTVADGQGKGYRVRLSKISSREIEGIIEEEFILAAEPPVFITLVQGIPKGEKMELIIQKSTELGVKEIIPLLAERSIVKLAG